MENRQRENRIVRTIKKLFLSAFVVTSFVAYALEHNGGTQGTGTAVTAGALPTATAPATPTAQTPADTGTSSPTSASPAAPTATSPAPSTASSGYKDGTYTGPAVDVNWGYVQVQATIQSGKLSNVQFLEYPSDRRTSQRINSIAGPELQQEALQAQSANVDIITGATLTSEGFAQSLQSALDQAKS